MNESTVQSFHLSQQYLIVVTKHVHNVSVALHDIFGIAFKANILNVNVLVEDGKRMRWSLHFYLPYVRQCDSLEIFEIGRFTPENYTNELDPSITYLFPRSIFRFNNCPLHVALFPFRPFVIPKQSNIGAGNMTYDGIDVRLVDYISKGLNLVPIYRQPRDNKARGMIYKNGTVTGAMKLASKRTKFHYL